MKEIMVVLLSYLIGNFSAAYVLGKTFKDVDIRNHGSGNAGATNALRILGKKMGVLTLFLDLFKGVLAVSIGGNILGFKGKLIAGIFVVIGHNFPVFLKFKGGKGVATSLGVIFVLNWKVGLICLVIGAVVITITKYVSLGSIIASIMAPILMILLTRSVNTGLYITTIILASLSVIRHRANIVRLYKKEENKLGNTK